MARATFVSFESLRRNQIREDHLANWRTGAMTDKLLCISKDLGDAEMYMSTAKEYIETSKAIIKKLADFISLAEVEIDTAEEFIGLSERRMKSLKSEINSNLAQNSILQASKDSVINVTNSSLDKILDGDTSEQVLNIIQNFVDHSESVNKYEIKHKKFNGVTVIVVSTPNVHGNSKYQDKGEFQGSKDSLDGIDRTLDCDLDSLDNSLDDSCDLNVETIGYYGMEDSGKYCIDVNGKFETSQKSGRSYFYEECDDSKTYFSEYMNEKLHPSSENCDNNCQNLNICSESYSDQRCVNRETTTFPSKYKTTKLSSCNEDFLIPELISRNCEVSIFSQKHQSECEKVPNDRKQIIETPKNENFTNKISEQSDFVYTSGTASEIVETNPSSIKEINECSTKKIYSRDCDNSKDVQILKEQIEDCPNSIDIVDREATSSNVVVNEALSGENSKPLCKISDDSTDASLTNDSYTTISEASCNTSTSESPSDKSINDDTSDTSVHDNSSDESLSNGSDGLYTDRSSTTNYSEIESSSAMSSIERLDSSVDEISSSYQLNTPNAPESDFTRSLLHNFSTVSTSDISALSQNEDIAYSSFKDGISSASLNNSCESMKENPSSKTNRLFSSKLVIENKEAKKVNIESSPKSESIKSQDCESLLNRNIESESFHENSYVVESSEDDVSKNKCETDTDIIQNIRTELSEINETPCEHNLIDSISSCSKCITCSITHGHITSTPLL